MARRILMSSVTAGGLGWLCTKYTVVTYKWRTVVQQHVTIKKNKKSPFMAARFDIYVTGVDEKGSKQPN